MPPITDLVEATEAAIIEGYRLGVLTELDRAAVQALRDLAVKISVQDEYFDALRHRLPSRRLHRLGRPSADRKPEGLAELQERGD